MLEEMYKMLDAFRDHVTEEKEVDRFVKLEKEINGRLGLKGEYAVAIPEAMYDFYRHFGNDDAFLNAFEQFYKVEDIRIEDQALVFADKYKKTGKLGIKLTDFGSPYMSVEYCPSDMHSWYSEGISGMEHFFFDYACWQVLSLLPFIAVTRMKETIYENFMTNDIRYFNDDKMYTMGGGVYSGYYQNILICYLPLEEDLYIAAREEQDLKAFEQKFGLKVKMIKPKKNAGSKNKNPFKKQFEALKKIPLGEMFQKLDVFRNNITEEMEVDSLTELGKENGLVIPEALLDFYRHFGRDQEFLEAYYLFDQLKDICVENGVLMFGYSDQYIARFGIPTADLGTGNEVVSYVTDDFDAVPLKIFLFHIAVWQIINTRTAVAVVEMSKRKFDALMKKGLQYFSDSEPYAKNSGFRAAWYEDILMCYIAETETLYAASKEDELLEEFGERFQLELDWL